MCPMNSQCTRPNICECDSGYRMTIETDSNMMAIKKLRELQRCTPISNNNFTEVEIVIYSLLICSLILLTLAGIFMVVTLLKRKRSDENNEASSWRTSFASYTSYEPK